MPSPKGIIRFIWHCDNPVGDTRLIREVKVKGSRGQMVSEHIFHLCGLIMQPYVIPVRRSSFQFPKSPCCHLLLIPMIPIHACIPA